MLTDVGRIGAHRMTTGRKAIAEELLMEMTMAGAADSGGNNGIDADIAVSCLLLLLPLLTYIQIYMW